MYSYLIKNVQSASFVNELCQLLVLSQHQKSSEQFYNVLVYILWRLVGESADHQKAETL